MESQRSAMAVSSRLSVDAFSTVVIAHASNALYLARNWPRILSCAMVRFETASPAVIAMLHLLRSVVQVIHEFLDRVGPEGERHAQAASWTGRDSRVTNR